MRVCHDEDLLLKILWQRVGDRIDLEAVVHLEHKLVICMQLGVHRSWELIEFGESVDTFAAQLILGA
eukprot:337000-Prymnesium_polylepis.1